VWRLLPRLRGWRGIGWRSASAPAAEVLLLKLLRQAGRAVAVLPMHRRVDTQPVLVGRLPWR
jgi:hypothetical protein